jgi:DNA-binding transcriptional MerR regulator
MYSIKEIAEMAGVTTRTLRYYDQLGLLKPASLGSNGYRYYDRGSLLRLQQILFYRELDVPLKDIQFIITRPNFQPLNALKSHRDALHNKSQRLDRVIQTIDRTIDSLEGDTNMNDQELFSGFDESRYEKETRELWGNTPKFEESQKKWSSFSKDQQEEIKKEGERISRRMVTDHPDPQPSDPGVQAAIEDYYNYLNKYFFNCEVEFLRGLADMWVQDPRFAVNYERIREGGAAFVREAVHIFCDNHQSLD